MALDFYETHSLSYRNQTVNIDPFPFLEPLTRHLEKGSEILDIGCGSGRDLLWLKERGYQPTGFERSSGLAELARIHSGCPVIKGDFALFDFSVFQFDAITLIGALVHLRDFELARTLVRISGAVRRDGLIYLTLKEGVGCFQNEDGRIFTLWRHEDLDRILNTLGFIILDFSKTESAINKTDTWLGYLLKNIGENHNVWQA
jgi:SAM-dependent methyltransferase